MTFLREFKDEDAKVASADVWAIDDLDFEDNLVAYDQKVEDNILCCCQKDLKHDESLKFMIKGDPFSLNQILF